MPELAAALETLNAREVLLAGTRSIGLPGLHTALEAWVFDRDYAERLLKSISSLFSLDGCGLARKPLAVGAAGAILHYLRDTQRSALEHLERPGYYDRSDAMMLDAVTVRNLELVEPLFAGESREVDACSTYSIRR